MDDRWQLYQHTIPLFATEQSLIVPVVNRQDVNRLHIRNCNQINIRREEEEEEENYMFQSVTVAV